MIRSHLGSVNQVLPLILENFEGKHRITSKKTYRGTPLEQCRNRRMAAGLANICSSFDTIRSPAYSALQGSHTFRERARRQAPRLAAHADG